MHKLVGKPCMDLEQSMNQFDQLKEKHMLKTMTENFFQNDQLKETYVCLMLCPKVCQKLE